MIGDGCGRPEDPTEDARPVNVVVYLVDTLRADRLGAYGYERARTPSIDQLAQDGVLFENCYSPGPWTVPSAMSLHTSLYPCDHGVLKDGDRIPPSVVPMAQRMKQAGYAAGGFICNPWAGQGVGLDRGYDAYVKQQFFVRPDLVDQWLDQNPRKPSYLYIHTAEPHRPYEPPEEFIKPFGQVPPRMVQMIKSLVTQYVQLTKVDFVAGRPLGTVDNTKEQQQALDTLGEIKDVVNLLYDAEVAYCDSNLGKLVEVLRRRGQWDDTIFVLLSDHGEELSERGGHQHDQSLYQELIHVPMIIKFPQNRFAGKRISDNVSLVDVLPTLLEYINRSDLAHDCAGQSLLSRIEGGEASEELSLAVRSLRINKKKYFKPYKETRGDFNVCVAEGNLKGIWNVEPDTFELYDLATDPQESNNLAANQPERVKQMRSFVSKWLETRPNIEKSAEDQVLDEAVLQELRDLGYVH